MTQTGVDMKTLGGRVKEARIRKGYNQVEAARIAGMNLPTYWHIEAGDKPHVRSDTLYKICRALEVSADSLLGLTGETDEEDEEDEAGMPPGYPRQAAAVASASS